MTEKSLERAVRKSLPGAKTALHSQVPRSPEGVTIPLGTERLLGKTGL